VTNTLCYGPSHINILTVKTVTQGNRYDSSGPKHQCRTMQSVIHDTKYMKVCYHLVPKLFSAEQKRLCMESSLYYCMVPKSWK